MSVNFNGKKRRGSALYIAMGLCCAAILLVGISSFINKRAAGEPDITQYLSPVEDAWLGEELSGGATPADADASTPTEPPLPDDAEGSVEAAAIGDEPAEQIGDTQAIEASAQAASEPKKEDAEPDAAKASKSGCTRPLAGDLLGGFSGDDLVYCATMCDWRVHSGTDIAGEKGSPVYAARDGIVYDVAEDALFGNTVIVQHEDHSMLYYCGLSANPMVSKGMEIKEGDVIGQLDIVPCEAGDPPHLHLAMMRDGKFVDPAKELGLA